MPFSLILPSPLRSHGWKVKIQDRERLEPPHVTIVRGRQRWRLDLRTGQFRDKEPDPNEVPRQLLVEIETSWQTLCEEWDARYPENPLKAEEADE